MKGVRINGQICFIRLEDAAEYLNCSVQTIRRYTDHRQREERRMNMIHFEGDFFKGLPRGLYLPVDEAKRFRDEIRPTFRFGGRDGRKKGSKDKKPRKKPEKGMTPSEWTEANMTPKQHINTFLKRADEMCRNMGW
jgi:hypothetical protein